MKRTKFIDEANNIMLGCDPEFFFSKEGKILGSEKVLPKGGKQAADMYGHYAGKVVIDGVQAELNPPGAFCRQILAKQIAGCFNTLATTMKGGVTANFSTAVKVDAEELDALSAGSRTLGCAPSQNLNKDLSGKIVVNPETYRYRSAGGHIHLGKPTLVVGAHTSEAQRISDTLDKPEVVVPLLDIIVGNTCVLMDRDPMNVERRKVYGRAGEYRLPAHGIEYRTPSNFWLRSYPLMSMIFALARDAVHVASSSTDSDNFIEMVMGAVDKKDIDQAINENRYTLAYKNFLKVSEVMTEIVGSSYYSPFANNRIKAFKYFLRRKPEHWFKEDPVKHWLNHYNTREIGFETFLEDIVNPQIPLWSRIGVTK